MRVVSRERTIARLWIGNVARWWWAPRGPKLDGAADIDGGAPTRVALKRRGAAQVERVRVAVRVIHCVRISWRIARDKHIPTTTTTYATSHPSAAAGCRPEKNMR
jgi:hypothetical protein